MLAYTHIPKAGGSTLTYLLRSQFGLRHVDVAHRFPSSALERHYRLQDLRFDCRIHPRISSIAGHWLKPYVDFGEYTQKLQWYTFVREPGARSFSQYVQDIQLGRVSSATDFDEWAQIDHLGGRNRNVQVKQLAGVEDATQAIRLIEERNIYVGMLENYDLSLLAWREFFKLDNFSLNYVSARNVRSKSNLSSELRERQPNLSKHLSAHNAEDEVLYDYVVRKRFPTQLADLGGQALLESISKGTVVSGNNPKWTWMNRVYRNCVYKPLSGIDRKVRSAS